MTNKDNSSPDYVLAHKFSSNHQEEISKDKQCGCFHCLAIFPPHKVRMWVEDPKGTAICPYCGIDSVIGESSGYPIAKDFLEKMRSYWFGED